MEFAVVTPLLKKTGVDVSDDSPISNLTLVSPVWLTSELDKYNDGGNIGDVMSLRQQLLNLWCAAGVDSWFSVVHN